MKWRALLFAWLIGVPLSALAQTGSITGTVTNSANGAPVASISIFIRTSSGPVSQISTDGAGQFTVAGLASGTYYAYTANSFGFFNEIYDNVQCGSGGCPLSEVVAVGQPIVVNAPAATPISFALTKGANISGTVTDGGTGLPIENVSVIFTSAAGTQSTVVVTTATGQFTSPGLHPGSYAIYTSNTRGYIDEIYDNVPCVSACSFLSGGVPITVSASEAVTGKNFALAAGGRISGTIRDAATAAPLPNVGVYVSTPAGVYATYGITDGSGFYRTTTGLPAGTYYAHTFNGGEYRDEVFDHLPCELYCSETEATARGTPIAVTAGAVTTGRDYALDRGGSLSGRLTDSTGIGISGVVVFAIAFPNTFVSATTDATGFYRMTRMAGGAYYVFTFQASRFGVVDEIYPDIACPGLCDTAEARRVGTAVTVAFGAETRGIGLSLAGGGFISGVVTDAGSGAPIPNVEVQVVHGSLLRVDEAGASAVTNRTGGFTVAGLPAGAYHAFTANGAGFIDELNGNLPCRGACVEEAAAASPPIAVVAGGTATINFALDKGGRISGFVVDDATGAPATSGFVSFSNSRGEQIAFDRTAQTGAYLSPALPPGAYFVAANASALIGEIYSDIPCAGPCSTLAAAAAGTPITVTAGAIAGGVDFALARGGTITGRITDAVTGIIQSNLEVDIYDSQGRRVDVTFVTAQGDFASEAGLPDGNYFALTREAVHHVNEIFNDVPCAAECSPSRATGGTPIAIGGAIPVRRDVALAPATGVPGAPLALSAAVASGGVTVSWVAPYGGGVAASYRLEAGFAPGSTALTIPVSGVEFVAGPVPPGTYFLRVRGVNGSGAGPASEEYRLVIAGGTQLPAVPTHLVAEMTGTRLMLSWHQDNPGGTPALFIVEAGSASGLSNIATVQAAALAFTYDPVPPGVYFLRVRAQNAAGTTDPSNEVMVVAGNGASPPPAPGSPSATVNGSTVTVHWIAPPAPVTGYILEAGSAPGLSNLATVPVGAVTAISFPGVPPGRYFVRIRAVNGLLRSVVSAEIQIVVG